MIKAMRYFIAGEGGRIREGEWFENHNSENKWRILRSKAGVRGL